MKAATGELQLTVITLIAIAAVIGFFWIMWDPIQNTIKAQWENVNDGETTASPGHSMIVNGYELVTK